MGRRPGLAVNFTRGHERPPSFGVARQPKHVRSLRLQPRYAACNICVKPWSQSVTCVAGRRPASPRTSFRPVWGLTLRGYRCVPAPAAPRRGQTPRPAFPDYGHGCNLPVVSASITTTPFPAPARRRSGSRPPTPTRRGAASPLESLPPTGNYRSGRPSPHQDRLPSRRQIGHARCARYSRFVIGPVSRTVSTLKGGWALKTMVVRTNAHCANEGSALILWPLDSPPRLQKP
jgi:hypothetical protein